MTFDENGGIVPLHTKSGIISVLQSAEGFLRIPRDAEGLLAGTLTEVFAL